MCSVKIFIQDLRFMSKYLSFSDCTVEIAQTENLIIVQSLNIAH